MVDDDERQIVASRLFQTDDGDLTLQILAGGDGSTSFGYQFLNESGEVTESLDTYGADSLQALLFCITAAGDYLQRYVPSASFAELGVTAMLTTDLGAVGEWRAQVSMPAVLPA
ncbi:hypothetical protein [Microbacterium saperdae]|uniref:Uncharacterized protein n=1 Tax=Microbacterium saperdae TaxID=69368 RepID=A0A543BAL5_9MICO|nr:hypothetical protein [Microbacterium saperdae]TQL81846.1 hypothetical protein FB560_3325 [Microbacterium saperdae]GGM35231.1 hypothetical protein GCM10010489_02600 [Microbacterium saperdae]